MNAIPALRGVVIFGVYDAEFAAMMYPEAEDSRVSGLTLDNAWARTQAGEAIAYVRH